ncbi:hypothetical protein RHGRI_035129 [Rhododendron griersonianum]|uniref:Disease resistance N-terminal domain-containing protein n=1 Tax=Rhododendron griersonianum TaxID=479676 RepID=A0AAV6I3Z6_9ERIC|nr:hypothetical protein RHGRI_035129 [Rhododendron griersonianum]
MGDIAVDVFLETLKQLITSSNLDVIIDVKDQLQSLENEIKYLREFLKVTEKKRKEHPEVMKLVMRIRDVVSESENIVEQFMVLVLKDDHAIESQDHLFLDLFFEGHSLDIIFGRHSLDLESVKKKIKTLMDEVKQIYKENKYDLNGVAIKKLKHSSTKSEARTNRNKRLTDNRKVHLLPNVLKEFESIHVRQVDIA